MADDTIVAQENRAVEDVLAIATEALRAAGYQVDVRARAFLAKRESVEVMVGVQAASTRTEVVYPRGKGLAVG